MIQSSVGSRTRLETADWILKTWPMQTILVPTDFSECARNALRYAVEIANCFRSRILLYHVFKIRVTSRSFVSIARDCVSPLDR